MNHYHIAVIAGDGIGKEITPEGVKVLQRVAGAGDSFRLEFELFPWGSDYYLEQGRMMPENGLAILRTFDAIYFGAVGWPSVPDTVSLWGLRLAICQNFEQYINQRPALLLPGIDSPLVDKHAGEIDFVVIRENTEGEYVGAGGRGHRGLPSEIAVETAIFTRTGVTRVMGYAFELAQTRPRKQLSCVTKSNAQQFGFVFWDEVFTEVAGDFPDVTTERVLVDAMAARMVLNPESLDVVVASNLHGDILTDLAGAICGSLGLAPSGNINPERTFPSMFEPIHGSAPDIYGQGIANPIGMFLSGAMMLDHLGEHEAHDQLADAIKTVTASRRTRTPDVGGQARTDEVTGAVLIALS